MTQVTLYCAGHTPALRYACQYLTSAGLPLAVQPQWSTRHLLLDVPSFRPGLWTEKTLDTLLSSLPKDILIWGGNLNHPVFSGYQTVDLLKDEEYLTKNAAITAQCTIPILEEHRLLPWQDCSTLLIGWGRITKALAQLLKAVGCPVTIATGDPEKLAEITDLEYAAANTGHLTSLLPQFRFLINTAPAPVLSREQCAVARDWAKIDLASVKGMDSEDVIWARGLPGKFAPEQSGKLIAETFLRLNQEVLP